MPRERNEACRAEPTVGRYHLTQRTKRLSRSVADRPHAAAEAAGGGEHTALHVDGVGTGPFVQAAELGGIVDQAAHRQDRPGAPDAEARPLPQRRALLVDDTRGVDHRADRAPVHGPGDAERDELAGGSAAPDADAYACGAVSGAPRGPLLRAGGARERQPVKVHAMLRTVSFTLDVAAYAAEGSKPEWMPQCSQRGSLPGPYESHSMF